MSIVIHSLLQLCNEFAHGFYKYKMQVLSFSVVYSAPLCSSTLHGPPVCLSSFSSAISYA